MTQNFNEGINAAYNDVQQVINEEAQMRERGKVSTAGATDCALAVQDKHGKVEKVNYTTKDAEQQVMQYCATLFAGEYARIMQAHVLDVKKYATNCGKRVALDAKSERSANALVKRLQLFGLACCRALPSSNIERANLDEKIKAFVNGKNAALQAKEKAERESEKRQAVINSISDDELLALLKARGLA